MALTTGKVFDNVGYAMSVARAGFQRALKRASEIPLDQRLPLLDEFRRLSAEASQRALDERAGVPHEKL